jgi:hypothetical protein
MADFMGRVIRPHMKAFWRKRVFSLNRNGILRPISAFSPFGNPRRSAATPPVPKVCGLDLNRKLPFLNKYDEPLILMRSSWREKNQLQDFWSVLSLKCHVLVVDRICFY